MQKKHPKEYIEKVQQLKKVGMSYSNIANELKTSRNAVAGILYRNKIKSVNKAELPEKFVRYAR